MAELESLQESVTRLAHAVEQLAAKLGMATEPLFTVTPIDAEALNRFLQAMGKPGETFFPNYSLTILVPAGSSVEFVYYIPNNFVCTRQTPWRVTSDYYHRNLEIRVFVDDKPITPMPAALTGATEFNFGEFYVKRRSVKMLCENKTTTDALVSVYTFCNIMHVDLYEKWYRLILECVEECLSRIAVSKGGRQF
jgi:hypothetical protein